MTSTEQATFENEISKTQLAHGVQLGVEVKISPTFSAFVKGLMYNLPGSKSFDYYYNEGNELTDHYGEALYGMGGITIKFGGGNKSKIK
jgi:hypothetical protein